MSDISIGGIDMGDSNVSQRSSISQRAPQHLFADAWQQHAQQSAQHFRPFQPFQPFAPASARDAWSALPRALADRYVQRAAAHRGRPWPQLLAHDWARFFRDGDRRDYETQYGAMRRRATDDLMAYGVAVAADGSRVEPEQAQALLADVIDGLTLICDQSAWQLPAHNAYVRDAPQLPWPAPDRPVLDLFAAETGQLLASALYLLGDALPEPIRRRIMRKLTHRIITPYLTERFWWMGEGDGPTNNWTTWCTQNVLATAFLAPFDDATRRSVVARATASLDTFVREYGDDGCCPEGAGYYHSSALCLFGAMRVLAGVAPDAFAPLWRNPKIAATATYIARVRIDENRYFNFSDCSVRAGLMGAREYLFAQAVGDDAMARTAASEWAHALNGDDSCDSEAGSGAENDGSAEGERAGLDPMSRISPLSLLLEASAANAMLRTAAQASPAQSGAAAQPSTAQSGDEPDTFFPSTGIAVMRGGGIAAAAKAGRNGFSHSHNDTGSVIVWRDGAPVLIDPGVETYTRQTFSPQRYDLWTMQSSWHNLPDFDGVMQEATPECEARDVRTAFGEDRSSITADLTHAWPAAARLRSYRRDVTLDKAARMLVIRDEAQGDYRTATMHLMTAIEPQIAEAQSSDEQIIAVGEATLRISGAAGPIGIEAKPIDAKLADEWGTDRLWRIAVPFAGSLTVTVR